MALNLGALIERSNQMDAILTNDEALDQLLQSNDKIVELMNLLIQQVENRLSENVLLLDNYITVDDEEMSIIEAQLKKFYLTILLEKVSKLGMIEKFEQIVDYVVKLAETITKAVYEIDVPVLEEDPEGGDLES